MAVHELWHVTTLGAHMHGIQTSPPAGRWLGLLVKHIACYFHFAQKRTVGVKKSRGVGKISLTDLDHDEHVWDGRTVD